MKDSSQKIINAIVKRLNLERPTYENFYIGKTDDFNDRCQEHYKEGYTFCWELAKGKSNNISKTEDELISYFKANEIYKEKILNENEGSGGNPKATVLYVAFKVNNIGYDELHDDALPINIDFPLSI